MNEVQKKDEAQKRDQETIFWDSLRVLENQHWITDSFKGRGDIEFSGNLRFSGEWTGSILSKSEDAHLYVMSDAVLLGKIKVPYLSVEGILKDVDVEAKVFRALKGARIVGSVRAEQVIIEEGALIEGRLVSKLPKRG